MNMTSYISYVLNGFLNDNKKTFLQVTLSWRETFIFFLGGGGGGTFVWPF